MLSINELKFHNLNVMDEILESNKTENRGDQGTLRGVKIFGAALSAINRKKITDPRRQRREIEKARQNIK